ncbi:MAG: ABC transporter ATP-binding protein [Micropruina sp.]|nr:ABC transporter ATP-binding protein [Micropruina sp.]
MSPSVSPLAVTDLRFRYAKGGQELFDGLSHTFAPSALTALTGPSGRGKSTLLYVLGLLLTPSSGHVLVDGVNVADASDAERSRLRATRVGFVFQDSELDPARTIVDAVIEPGLYAGGRVVGLRGRAYELLEQFGLADRADHRPGQISGGQAQRVAVCRALLNDPAIVLADEPTGNLDRGNAERVLEALTSAAKDHAKTVVIATHDPFVLSYCDQRVEL